MSQKRIQKTKTDSSQTTAEPVEAATKGKDAKAEELKEHTDDLLDEIDSVLEENAEEFVKSYIQRGGE